MHGVRCGFLRYVDISLTRVTMFLMLYFSRALPHRRLSIIFYNRFRDSKISITTGTKSKKHLNADTDMSAGVLEPTVGRVTSASHSPVWYELQVFCFRRCHRHIHRKPGDFRDGRYARYTQFGRPFPPLTLPSMCVSFVITCLICLRFFVVCVRPGSRTNVWVSLFRVHL